jgi:hypothetical protein
MEYRQGSSTYREYTQGMCGTGAIRARRNMDLKLVAERKRFLDVLEAVEQVRAFGLPPYCFIFSHLSKPSTRTYLWTVSFEYSVGHSSSLLALSPVTHCLSALRLSPAFPCRFPDFRLIHPYQFFLTLPWQCPFFLLPSLNHELTNVSPSYRSSLTRTTRLRLVSDGNDCHTMCSVRTFRSVCASPFT